jgi:hypothetical protein
LNLPGPQEALPEMTRTTRSRVSFFMNRFRKPLEQMGLGRQCSPALSKLSIQIVTASNTSRDIDTMNGTIMIDRTQDAEK